MTTPANASNAYKKEISTIVGSLFNVTNYGATGNGVTDDRVNCQAAIDAAEAAGGGTVIFPRGTYSLTKAAAGTHCLNIESSNVHIILNAGATLKMADAQVTVDTHFVYVVLFGDGSSVFSNMSITGQGTIDYNAAGQTYTAQNGGVLARGCLKFDGANVNSLIDGIKCINANGDCIFVKGVSDAVRGGNVTVQNTKVLDSAEGISIRNMNEVRILGNHVENITGYVSAQDGIEPASCDNVTIANNVIKNVEGSGVDVFDKNTNVTITGNAIDTCGTKTGGSGGDGITVGGTGAANTNIVISGNAITDCGADVTGYGIATFQDTPVVSNLTINGNVIKGSNLAGIRTWSTSSIGSICGNIIDASGQHGLLFKGSNFVIDGNIITDPGQGAGAEGVRTGIRLDEATDSIISNNLIKDTVAGGLGTLGQGILVITAGTDGLTIIGNEVIGAGGDAIEVQRGSHLITNNKFIDYGNDDTLIKGISITSTCGVCEISNNMFENGISADVMIHMHIQAPDQIIKGNTVLDSSTGGTVTGMKLQTTTATCDVMSNVLNGLLIDDDGTSNFLLSNKSNSINLSGATTPDHKTNFTGY